MLERAREFLKLLRYILVTDALLDEAARQSPPSLRSLDATHLASMLSVRETSDAVVIYDGRLAEVARDAGLTVLAPGA